MQKAIPTGSKSPQISAHPSQAPLRQSRPDVQSGNLAQLAAAVNRSPRVQAQLKVADELRSSGQVEAQVAMSERINSATPLTAQLDDGKKKKRTGQMKSKDEATVTPRQFKVADGVTPAQLEEAPSPNRTGLPDQLKAGVESLSGVSLDSVKVHYNSPKPAQLNALAYAQGTDIHVASGQEKHLPHETWHVVQQHQGRVRPTTQAKGVAINDDSGLEKEADVMGAKANVAQMAREKKKK
jgi:hypothetical protein